MLFIHCMLLLTVFVRLWFSPIFKSKIVFRLESKIPLKLVEGSVGAVPLTLIPEQTPIIQAVIFLL